MSELPAGWALTTFGELVDVVRPRVAPQEREDLPFIGMEDLEPHTMRLLATKAASSVRSAAVHFQSGDVLYGRLRPYLNKVYGPDFEGLCSAEFIPLTPRPGVAAEFLQYRLNAADFVAFASHLDEGDRPRVSADQIGEFSLPIPSLPEQRRIVAAIESYLTRLDAAVAGLERVQRNLKRYRASVLKAAVEGRLVPTEAELARAEGRDYEPASVLLERILAERRKRWQEAGGKGKYKEPVAPDTRGLPELPTGWCGATIGAIAEVKGGLTKNQARRSATPLRQVPYLRVANVQRGFLDLHSISTISATEDEIVELSLEVGDVLFNEGGDRDKLGRGWVWGGQIPSCIHQNHVFRARMLTRDLQPKLVSWFGNTEGQRYFFDEGKQTTNLASINMTKLRSLPIPVAPVAEQQRIVAEVERLLSVVDGADRQLVVDLAGASRLRQAILKWAFEGRLVDQDPDDEPASVLLERIRAEREAVEPKARSRRAK